MKNRVLSPLLSMVFVTLGASPAVAQTQNFHSYQEVKQHYIRMATDDGKEKMDMSKFRVKEVDLNGDGKLDYWLINDELFCGSSGCWGSAYLWTAEGYCEGYEVKEEEIARKKLPPNKCKPLLGPHRTW